MRTARVCTLVTALVALPVWAGGTVAGTIAFSGVAPKMGKLLRKGDQFCARTEVIDPTVTLSKDGKALANVFVQVVGELPKAAVPPEPLVVDQKDCMYLPRVQGAIDGQKLSIRNSDGTLHNVRAVTSGQAASAKTLFNTAQPPRGRDLQKEAKGAELIRMKCDVHPWMVGYIHVLPHGFFSVTNGEGKFEIKDVPPGSYRVRAWHEKYGTVEAELKVEEGKTVDPALGFKG